MTEKEAFKRFIKAFGGHIPKLDTEDFWNKFANGQRWLDSKFIDGEFKGYAEQYFRAYMTIACIEYEIERDNQDEDTARKI